MCVFCKQESPNVPTSSTLLTTSHDSTGKKKHSSQASWDKWHHIHTNPICFRNIEFHSAPFGEINTPKAKGLRGVVLYYCISGVVLRIFMEKVSPTCHKKTPPTIRGQGRMYRVIKITVSLSFFRERLDLGIWNEELVRNIKSQVSQEDIKTSGDCFSFWGGAPFLTNFK